MPADWIVVGQVGAPYGVRGWNHVRSFTRPVGRLLDYRPWYIQQREGWVEIECVDGRQQGEGLVVKLQGVDDRDRAALMTQQLIAIHRDQREAVPEGVFYWADLEGLEVKNLSGQACGRIRHLYENAGVDVMVIDHEGKEYHVPFVMHDTVLGVDLNEGCVVIDWSFEHPEG